MRRRRPFLIALVVLAAVAPMSSTALAASPASTAQVVADCNAHARLIGSYSEATLRHALATLPAVVAEYTNCADVIRRQLLTQVGSSKSSGSGSGGGSSGSFLPTWVIVVLVVAILGGATGTALARRRGVDGAP